ncbi:MAG: tetratricopeptide repeat protein [Bryobacterales bacterium]|nr:tetratricopeptide repeat protein [Bryobacterales bacterium]
MKLGRIGVIALVLLALAACGDSEASKKRLLETGNKYYTAGKFREASIIYRKLIQKDPRFGEAYYRLGLNELRQGRPVDAVRALRRAVELQPDNDDAHAKLGDLYLMFYLNDKQKGRQLLVDLEELSERMLKRNPRSFQGTRMKGYVYVSKQEWPDAIKTFRTADELKPDDPEVLIALVQALGKNDQVPEAEKLARGSIEKHKDYGLFYDFIYSVRMKEKKVAEAEQVLKEKLANNPKSWPAVQSLATHYAITRNPEAMLNILRTSAANTQDFPTGHDSAGKFLYSIGDLENARKEFEAGIATDAKNKIEYQKKIIELLSAQGQHDKAVQMADQVLAENKDNSELKAIRAALRLRGGKREELDAAIKEFQSVQTQMGQNPVYRFNLGEAYMAKGDLEQAKGQFQEALKQRPNYIAPKISMARIHLAQREYARAQTLADEVLKVSPNFLPPRMIRIEALMGLRDFATARNELNIIAGKLPEHKDSQQLLAVLDLAENKQADAEKRFRALYEGNPPDYRGLFGLAQVYASTNRLEPAKQLLEKELAKQPPFSRNIKLALAEIAMRGQKFDEASGIYNSLVQEAPTAADLWVRLGEAQRRAKKYDDSLRALDKAKELAPRDPQPWLQTALTLEAAGRHDQVRQVYEQIIKVAPDNAIALNNVAFFLAESGQDLDQALTYAQRAKQQMPNNPDVADTLGLVYIKKNLSDDAIKIFRDLVSQRPDHVTWRYHLALALFQKGDKLQAKKELEVAMKNNPRPDETQKMRELLGRIG